MKPLSIYTGTRDPVTGRCSVVVTTDGREYKLNPRTDLTCLSQDFEWGFTGQASTQLAIAILADCLGENEAIANYQYFRRDMISGMPARGWSLTSDQINSWMNQRGRLATVDETDGQDCEGR